MTSNERHLFWPVLVTPDTVVSRAVRGVGALAHGTKEREGEAVTADEAQKCDDCGRPMTFVRRPQPELYGAGGQITVPLASKIWECEKHGSWRIYISGARERVENT